MTFIGQYQSQDHQLSLDIIQWFESSQHEPGSFFIAGQSCVDLSVKSCSQCLLDTNTDLWLRYQQFLQLAADAYTVDYPWSNSFGRWAVREPILIQRYLPGQAYHAYHCERPDNSWPAHARHLVFMTYLNTVSDQGGTEFPQQNLIIAPQQSMTVIWPADWTHVHRGIPSSTQIKYIATGWFQYL